MHPQPLKLKEFENVDLDAFADHMAASLAPDAREYVVSEKPQKPFHEWVQGVTLDGRQFTYDRHEYLIEPYQDFHPHQVEIKATQLGLTSKAMLRCIYAVSYTHLTLPTNREV